MVTLILTEEEVSILKDIDEIGFGSMWGVEVNGGVPTIKQPLPEVYQEFFDTLRRVGAFNEVRIHGGLPAYAIQNGATENGRPCTRKYKFK